MENKDAITSLAALAHDTRLSVFRQLVQAGPDGLAAGTMSSTLGIPPQTLSFHLKELSHAGLVSQRREGRSIIYAPDFDHVVQLVSFLGENCCGGLCNVAVDATRLKESVCENPAC